MKLWGVTGIGAAVVGAALLAGPTASKAEAVPSPAPTISPGPEQYPEGACIYGLAGIVDLFCEPMEEKFCQRHMGGFVSARWFSGKTCKELKDSGEY